MNRGSEWRKWDLHVHTPASLTNNYKGRDGKDVWETYIDDLEHLPADIKVIGINDYLFIEGYRKVLEYKQNGRLKNIDLILPVIEFRLATFAGNQAFKRINFHVIFSDELSSDTIQHQFLNGLSRSYKLSANCSDYSWNGVITSENLRLLGQRIIESVPEERRSQYGSPMIEGFNNLNFEYSEIMKVLETGSTFFEGKYLTAIGKSEWDDLKWDDNTIADKKNIINSADFVFTASENVGTFQKSKKSLEKGCVNSLLLDCSDAHSNLDSNNKDKLGNCNTWIKADTTFAGLKQIMYEPEERVRIQQTCPDNKSGYQVIDSIKLNEEGFWNQTVYFNSYLNTIIGGRSTGKSTLLKAIVLGINQTKCMDDFLQTHKHGIQVLWRDGQNLDRDIDYVNQNHMYDIAKDSNEVDKLINNILKSKNESKYIDDYKNECSSIASELSEKLFLLKKIYLDLQANKKALRELGDKKGVEAEIKVLSEKIDLLKKNSILSDEEQIMYQNILIDIESKKSLIAKAESDSKLLNKMRITTPFRNTYAEENDFSKLSDFNLHNTEVPRLFKGLVVRTEMEWVKIVEGLIARLNADKDILKGEISECLTSSVYIKGQKFYSDNQELASIQKKMDAEKLRYAEIINLETMLTAEEQKLNDCIAAIVQTHKKYLGIANYVAQHLNINHDGIKISVDMSFQQSLMESFIEENLNMRNADNKRFLNSVFDDYLNSSVNLLDEIIRKGLENRLECKRSMPSFDFMYQFLLKNWYGISYKLQYQGDSFTEMSEGKKAFVILKLLLDFSDKTCPILIDQPEDSLDNRAIYKELVSYIKRKKEERQIILVTHNPNVVVSADAENVIVANQHGSDCQNNENVRFLYVNGSLENTKTKDNDNANVLQSQGIREHVCEILEGGKEAFEKREHKYGFK